MKNSTFGIFMNREDASAAISDLEEKGYDPQDVSIVMKDKVETEKIVEDTGANVVGGAASGATTGGVLGGIAGLLVGIGAIAIPGIGAVLIGGPIAAALGLVGASALTVEGAVTGAVAGGLLGGLVGLGVPASEARVYEDRIKEGAILVAVGSSNGDVKHIFEKHNATQIRSLA